MKKISWFILCILCASLLLSFFTVTSADTASSITSQLEEYTKQDTMLNDKFRYLSASDAATIITWLSSRTKTRVIYQYADKNNRTGQPSRYYYYDNTSTSGNALYISVSDCKKDTTNRYYYVPSRPVTINFKFIVGNGSWNDGTTLDKTANITGTNNVNSSIRLTSDKIPAVGNMPASGYEAGSWTPVLDTTTRYYSDVGADNPITYTYTYTKPAVIPVESVSLSPATLSLKTGGDDGTLTPTVLPDNATNKNVTWSSSDDTVATVSGGVVTPLKAGSTTITVTTADGGKTATCSVTVTDPVVHVESVSLSPATLSLKTGGATGTLTPTVLPDNATDKSVTWDSSDKTVATVAGGVVTPLKAGSTTITVTTVDGNKTAACNVTVSDPDVLVTEITLNQSKMTMGIGNDATLQATVKPDNATNKNVTWSSDATDVATVDGNGTVHPVSPGDATITATAADGSGVSASCAVTVSPKGYKILEGDEQVYYLGSGTGMKFRGEGAFSDFEEAMVDDQYSYSDYKEYFEDVKEGSTILTIKSSLPEKLGASSTPHTLTMKWKDGTATATFYIKKAPEPKPEPTPETGDSTLPFAFGGLALLSAAAFVMLKRKSR